MVINSVASRLNSKLSTKSKQVSAKIANVISKNIPKVLNKEVLLTSLSALAATGIFIMNNSSKSNMNSFKPNPSSINGIKYSYSDDYDDIPESHRGTYGQDIYDYDDVRNNDDPLSPFYNRRGAYNQDVYDPDNPYNAQDPCSPYYNENNNFSY